MKKQILALSMAALIAAALTACSSKPAETAAPETTQAQTAEAAPETEGETAEASEEATGGAEAAGGTLVMATNAEFPPYEYYEDGDIVGIDVEIAKAIAAKLGMELQIEDMAFDAIIPAVTSGKADFGAAGMTVTEERQRSVEFTDTYANSNQVAIVKEDSDITGSDALAGKIIGVQLGTTGDALATEIKDATVERYNKGLEAVQSLTQGKIDAVVIDQATAEAFVKKTEGIKILEEKMSEEEYAIAIKKGCKTAAEAAAAIGEGLQSFCIPGSVADQRKVGLGHGNLGKMLLEEDTDCFCFLAGHESFAAAEGAIGIAEKANKVRKKPLRVILNGLGKDAAKIISRINGFTYVQTEYDYYTGELKEVQRISYSDGLRSKVNCYGANDVREGVAIMWKEGVDVSITGNSTNPTRFQHPVAGTYKKECVEKGKKYFSVASGGGTGRTLHPDNMAAGPASYGMTDTLGRMHSDAQFAGSSSVPAHVEMMGLIGAGNNPMVGMTVAVAVSVEEAAKAGKF